MLYIIFIQFFTTQVDKDILQAIEALEQLNLLEIGEIDKTLGAFVQDPEEVPDLTEQQMILCGELKQGRQHKHEVLRRIAFAPSESGVTLLPKIKNTVTDHAE
jgi:hypothetical protein